MATEAMKGELVGEVELTSGPDKFFNMWKSEAHQAPNHAPNHLQAVKVHEGEWDKPGSIRIWNYTIDGKQEVFKDRIEVDEEKKMLKLIGVDGDVFKIYKVYNGIWHIIPKGEGYIAKIVIEYEKLSPDVPAPHNYLNLLINFTKDIDAGLVKP